MSQTINEDAAAAAAGADPAAAAATAGQEAGQGGGDPGAGGAGKGEGGALVTAPGAETDYLPEKYRVAKDDGTIDEPASARKLADAYKALETKLGAGGVPPKAPEDYKVEGLPEGLNFEEIKTDPLYQGFLKGAHGKGMSNEQVSYVLGQYFELLPQLEQAKQALNVEDARTELSKLWPDTTQLNQNLVSVQKAIQAFGGESDAVPGARSRLYEKFGNDPDFIAFGAAVARELGEDVLPVSTPSADADIDTLMRSEDYWNPDKPNHAQTVAKVQEHFKRKHGTARR